MGKTIGKVLKVVGVAALSVATFNPGFLALAGVSTGALGLVGAVSAVAGGLLDPPSAGLSLAEQGRVLSLRTSTTAFRPILYGKAATGGALVYREATGDNNQNLHLVIALAGHKVSSLEGFKFGKDNVDFNVTGSAIGKYSGFMKLSFHDGAGDQIADAALVNSSSKWTGNHKLSGISYAYLKLLWDHEVFPQGVENTLFTLKGRKLYDPRKDPSNGGAPLGTHGINDENTWEWSDNPVLAMVDYLMGIRVGGNLIAGMGVSASRIDWPNIIAEANICDEPVPRKSGGDEPRYTVNGWVEPNNTHRDNLKALSSSCGGALVFQSGKWRCYVAAPRAAVKSRCADDVVGPLSMQAKKSSSMKVNSVRGIFADPSSDYELKDYPPLQNQTYVSEDGGNELWQEVNLPFTKSASMAQRLAKIALARSRMEKVVKASFTLGAIEDQAMDTISFTHHRFNLHNQNMVCTDWRLSVSQTQSGNEGLVVECAFVEERDDIYSWSSLSDEVFMSQTESVITQDRKYLDHGKIPGEINYTTQVSGNVFSDEGISFANDAIGFGTPSKPDMNASKGAKLGENLLDETGVALTDNSVKNDRTVWSDLAGKTNVPEANATLGAIVGENLLDEAGIALTDNSVKNDRTVWSDLAGKINVPEANATVGAKAGVNLFKADATALYDADIVTSLGQAATIAYQGTLATKNNVNLATLEVLNKTADYIESSALKRWSTARRELGVGSARSFNPITAMDAGLDAIISIAAHTAYLGDGTGISFNSGSITGKAYSTGYYVYAAVTTLASGSQTVTYLSTTTKETLTQNDNYYFVGDVTTPAALASPTTGYGGGGGFLASL